MRQFTLTLLLISSLSLTGCYCLHKLSVSEPRNLSSPAPFSLCDTWSGDDKRILLNAYTGFSLIQKDEILSNIAPDYWISPQLKNFGQYGVRGEYLLGNSNLFYTVGIDYSFSRYKINCPDNDDVLQIKHHRYMASLNVITLIKARTVGYLTIQTGNNLQVKYMNTLEGISPTINQRINYFDYRTGYGFQFYLNSPFALTIEGGFGSGVYFKTGICYWLF